MSDTLYYSDHSAHSLTLCRFDCAECHNERMSHPIERKTEMVFACKACRKTFRVDLAEFDPETDSFCPHCDNEWYMEAETADDSKQMTVKFDTEVDESVMLRDERDQGKERRRKKKAEELAWQARGMEIVDEMLANDPDLQFDA
jgi:uncharacterized CHY-type Zn-finger protein